MNTHDIVRTVRAKGVMLKRNCDKLRVSCAEGLLTEAQAEYIREHRDEILGILDKERKLQCTIPELSTDPLPGDGADRDPGSAGARAQIPGPNSTQGEKTDYFPALTVRIQALEAEYAAAHGEPVPGELFTCGELSWKIQFPAEQRLKYRQRYEALSLLERLKEERDQAAGRNCWPPGPKDELLRQQADGSFVPAELAELDQAVPAPTEITVIMGQWNQMILGKKAAKVSRTASGVVKCELVGDIPKHEKEISKGKISKKTAMEYQKGA